MATSLTKALLSHRHDKQRADGFRLDVHQNSIIEAFGGIDELLSMIFTSDIQLDQDLMINLSDVMTTHTDNAIGRSQHGQSAESSLTAAVDSTAHLVFDDADTFMFIYLGDRRAHLFLNALQSRITKAILVAIVVVTAITTSVNAIGKSGDLGNVVLVLSSSFSVIYSIYMMLWLSYLNAVAFKRIAYSFIFALRSFYLCIFEGRKGL